MKITNAIRELIIQKAIKASGIPERRAKIEADLAALSLKVYNHFKNIPPELEVLLSDPEKKKTVAHWINHTTHLDIECEGFHYFRHFKSRTRGSEDGYRENLPGYLQIDSVPWPLGRDATLKIKGVPHLESAAIAMVKYHRETNAMEDGLRQKLRSVLWSANTKAQLLKIWPECEPFLPEEVAKAATPGSNALVPVGTVLELNKALGITK